jgi:hypothetical protein
MRNACRLTLALLLLLASAIGAKAEQKAYSVPVSQKIVNLEVQVPDGHWIKGAVLEGDQFRVEDHDLKVTMAFIPLTKAGGGVLVRVFRIEKHEDGNESIHFVEEIESGLGETAYTKKAAAAFSVRVVKVTEPPAEGGGRPALKSSCKASSGSIALSKFIAGRCCITCGGNTSCGCAVDDTCGSCCAGGCCQV